MAYTFEEMRDQLALEAMTYADQYSIPVTNNNPLGWNDARDAFRHAYTSAVIGFEYSLYASKIAGDWHEYHRPDDDPRGTNMDQWNNEAGRRIAGGLSPLEIFGDYKAEIARRVYESLQGGDLIIDLNDERRWQGTSFFADPNKSVSENVRNYFVTAERAVILRDPLTLDLDGDGLETIPASAGVLFDHDGDGVATGTGWVGSDDGLLVWDRNTNGQIDSGRELFGDSTIKSNSQFAVDGFDALADLDTNADGVVNASDTNFAQLRVWRDTDQDGVTDAGELSTLSSLGIAGFNTAKTENDQVLADGNHIADLGTYIRTDGSTATMGDVGEMADIDLVEDTFHRRFDDEIPLTEQAQQLPTMQGSGLVRDMREAASLQTTEGGAYAAALADYSGLTTRFAQLAALNGLLAAWAQTSTLPNMVEAANSVEGADYAFIVGNEHPYHIGWGIDTRGRTSFDIDQQYGTGTMMQYEELTEGDMWRYSPAARAWLEKIGILEAFNGRNFVDIATLNGASGNDTINGLAGADSMSGGLGNDTYFVDNNGDQVIESAGAGIDLVNSSVTHTLGANVENLVLAGSANRNGTGNALDNVITGNSGNNTLNGGAGNDYLDGGTGSDSLIGGLGDDTFVVNSGNDSVNEQSGAGNDTVRSSISHTLGTNVENLILTGTSTINGTGNALANVMYGNGANNTLTAAGGNDLANGGAGNDTLRGDAGNDVLEGMDGNDTLSDTGGNNYLNGFAGTDTLTGGSGKELLIGGAGNDTLATGSGADIIAFNWGDGQDSVNASSAQDNTLSLGGGISYVDLFFRRGMNDLILETGNNEQVTLKDWYTGSGNHSVQNLQAVAEAMEGYDPNSADPLLNQKVQQFDFQDLVDAFDQAKAADPGLDRWALMNKLLDAHLAASDTEALGGDLAYQYGVNGSLAGIGLTPAQDVLNAPQFGTGTQTLRPLSSLQDGLVRLS